MDNVVTLLAVLAKTPGAFYRGMRLMALDGFVVDVADTPDNERIYGRPQRSFPRPGGARTRYQNRFVHNLCFIQFLRRGMRARYAERDLTPTCSTQLDLSLTSADN